MAFDYDIGTIAASVVWGNVGVAMIIYGKKNENWNVAGVGVAMFILSWLLSWVWLTIASLALCLYCFRR